MATSILGSFEEYRERKYLEDINTKNFRWPAYKQAYEEVVYDSIPATTAPEVTDKTRNLTLLLLET